MCRILHLVYGCGHAPLASHERPDESLTVSGTYRPELVDYPANFPAQYQHFFPTAFPPPAGYAEVPGQYMGADQRSPPIFTTNPWTGRSIAEALQARLYFQNQGSGKLEWKSSSQLHCYCPNRDLHKVCWATFLEVVVLKVVSDTLINNGIVKTRNLGSSVCQTCRDKRGVAADGWIWPRSERGLSAMQDLDG